MTNVRASRKRRGLTCSGAKRSIRYEAKRLEAREPANQIVSDWTAKINRNEVIQHCCDGDVPCGPVNSIAEIFTEEQFWMRETCVTHDRIGDFVVPGVIPVCLKCRERFNTWAAGGENNSKVFRDWLDIGENELVALEKAGVV
jgi:succinyl-CoA:(S)-malate CoA-transferase subunit A